jgi:hypothetical protein
MNQNRVENITKKGRARISTGAKPQQTRKKWGSADAPGSATLPPGLGEGDYRRQRHLFLTVAQNASANSEKTARAEKEDWKIQKIE